VSGIFRRSDPFEILCAVVFLIAVLVVDLRFILLRRREPSLSDQAMDGVLTPVEIHTKVPIAKSWLENASRLFIPNLAQGAHLIPLHVHAGAKDSGGG